MAGSLRKKSNKSKKSKKRKISAQQFKQQFTTIVAGHLSTLPPEEQDRRIRAAQRVVLTRSRDASAITREVSETPEIRLAARTRE